MSWMKRPRASPGAAQGPGQNTFNPAQPPMPGNNQPIHQQQWPPQQQPHIQHSTPHLQQQNPIGNFQQLPPAPQQQFWPSAQPQQQNIYDNPQQNNHQRQENYTGNEYFQYNQQYTAQQGYQNYQQQQQVGANVTTTPQHTFQSNDMQQSWEPAAPEKAGDAWDWGWQDETNTTQQPNTNRQQNVMQSNANIIDSSFSNAEDSWNWSLDEQQSRTDPQHKDMQSRKSSQDTVIHKNMNAFSHSSGPRPQQSGISAADQTFTQTNASKPVPLSNENNNKNTNMPFPHPSTNMPHMPVSEPNIKSLNDKDALLEHDISMPNMAVMAKRRYLNDTLTPQWSTESQPSQDSSDGLLTESTTNRSDDPSTKSSPSFTQDNTNFNFPQNIENSVNTLWSNPPFENIQENVTNEYSVEESVANRELTEGMKGMNINRNTASPLKGNLQSMPADAVPPQARVPMSSQDRCSPNIPLLPPSSKPSNLPPSGPPLPPVAASSSNSNPFKRSANISHKTANRIVTQQIMSDGSIPPQLLADPQQPFNQLDQSSHPIPNARQPSPALQTLPLASPKIVQQQNYTSANLETTPDNSERPDVPIVPAPVNFRSMHYAHGPSVTQDTVENFEVAPNNDRNEYLQTRHLSDVSFENTNYADDSLADQSGSISQENFPPPGLRRMVLGQPESDFNQSSNDEPPPGLSRMVPGQLNDSNNIYTQPSDDFLDRQVDGQTTESESLNSSYMNRTPNVYRVGDGQPTDDETNYPLNQSRNAADRRPVGLDRMVPGESSNFQSFQSQNFPGDTRVVTGFDQNTVPERRDQNMDGSDYTELDAPSQVRSIVGVETVEDRNTVQDNLMHPQGNDNELNQREINMEGENLQDLSVVSSTDFSLIRDQNMDGADIQDEATNRPTDLTESGSERQASLRQLAKKDSKTEGDKKYHDDTTGDESERDRYSRKNRKEKERMRVSRERDGRYSSDKRDEKRERDKRADGPSRNERDRERVRDEERPYRRSNRDARYETEDTDYYSDRDRRRYREGSYTASSKPPRPDRRDDDSRRSYDRSLRDTDRDSRRHRDGTRYNSGNKEENSNDSDRDVYNRKRGDKDRGYDDRDRRYDRRDGGYNSLRKSKIRDDRKRDTRYPSRPDSRDPDPTEEEDPNNETGGSMSLDRRGRNRRSVERDDRGHKRDRRDRDRGYAHQYYDSRYSGYPMDQYSQQMYQHQHQTYQYFEKLRLTNPQAYVEIYNKYMRGQRLPYGDVYSGLPSYDQSSTSRLGDERDSVHSGQSSTNGEALKDRMLLDTSFGGGSNAGASNNYFYPIRSGSYRQNVSMGHRRMGSGSMRTDVSDSRDYNTDSINFGLENSTVKSERMTPVKFATAHIKGVISSTNLVTVTPSYPIDGQPAIVEILDLNKILINDGIRCELSVYPGPLIKGTTHKKTVIEYCEMKIREALDRNVYMDKNLNFYGKQHHGGFTNTGNSNSVSERQTISSVSHVPTNCDVASYVLMWELLILLLRQNGMVVGTDIAELLIKNKKQFEWRSGNSAPPTCPKNLSRRGSNSSVTSRSAEMPIEEVMPGEDNAVIIGHADGEDSSNDAGSLKHRSSSQQQLSNKPTSGSNANVRRASSNANILESPAHEKYVTDKFREYLLFGNGKEALEWAMSHGLWGHALFLASKLDKRTYANVMMRFANGLAANDPLQTLYQLMSGRQPASVTCILDEKWGDWRPHLAMILSNTTQRPELDRKSILALGDTLLSRGDVYAAHFCYLMSREEPGSSPGSRLQLLGLPLNPIGSNTSPSSCNPYKSPSHNIIMTEIYEYACSLNQAQRATGHFQFYKYLLATRLVDCGLYERALLYLETIAEAVALDPHQYQGPFLQRVLDLADRLKYYDPEENVGDLSLEDQQDSPGVYSGSNTEGTANVSGNRNVGDKMWLTTLRETVAQIAFEPSSHAPYSKLLHNDQYQSFQQQGYQQLSTNVIENDWSTSTPQSLSIQQQQQHVNNSYDHLQMQQQQELYERQQQQQQQIDQQQNLENTVDGSPQYLPQMYNPNSMGQGKNNSLPSYNSQQESRDEGGLDYNPQMSSEGGVPTFWGQDQQQYGYHENKDTLESLEPPRAQISLPNSAIKSSQYEESDQDHEERSANQQKSTHAQEQQQQRVNKEKKETAAASKTQASSGWFGGIFNKLSLKPKNQMILPDDKNPSIVWDPEKKKWVNLDSDKEEKETELAPPPKMSDIMRTSANINNNIPPPAMAAPTIPSPDPMFMTSNANANNQPPANVPNIFKLQKTRHIKKAYVDVFNPSGAPMKPLAPASEVLGDPMMMSSQPQGPPTGYFIPGAGTPSNEQGNAQFYNPADY